MNKERVLRTVGVLRAALALWAAATRQATSAVIGVGLCIGCIGCMGCQERTPPPKPPIPVKVWTVEANTAKVGARFSATIRPEVQVELAFKVGGYVEQILQVRGFDGQLRDVQAGDRAVKGTVLARLRESDYLVKRNQAKAQLAEVEAGLAQAQSFLGEAEASFQQAKADFERAQNLLQAQSLPKSDFDAAKARYEMTQAAVARAKAQLQMAGARVEALRQQLEETELALGDSTLKAPMDAVVIKRGIEVGSLAIPGAAAIVLADTTSVRAVFGVPDVMIQQVALGGMLKVTTESMRGSVFQGRISRIAPSADLSSRVFEVELTIPNPKDHLKAGMIASLEVSGPGSSDTLPAVPLSAVVRSKQDSQGYAVYVVEGAGDTTQARLRNVALGNPVGNKVVVLKGLKAGERVIVVGTTLVTDGERIQIIP